jgi:hypothetical protein
VLGVGAANLVRLLDVDRVLLGGRTVLADPDVFVDGVAAQLRAPGTGTGVRAGTGAGTGTGVRTGTGARTGTAVRTAGSASGVAVEVVPEGARTVADGAAQLVLAPLFGRAPGAPAAAG